ncbi:hypothetical protein [Staphylococcus intermedius]|uniref:Uncharacterized protein n=1 Tax=Staphylococcus intermedius NCTC 11048 TaxID=1141106 RepID=A0A380GAA0_STAIN|nr:hypothetical protein [Staphylococcus intermedius]PNZ52438.1 hypothetical protein CD138_06355 [Staphylococcus intermedius NCTC 11048]SUM47270.1 Uncharacterised protein [Staphylococcus intermedius NCTC 11048]
MNTLVNLGERIIQLEKERDTLINDITGIRKERDKLQRKLDEVVELFNTHLAYKKAWSDNPYYDKLQNELNKILEDAKND